MFTVDIVNMTQTLQHPYQPQWREEPPPVPDLSLLRPALLLQAAMSISLFLGTIPLSGLNPLALLLLLPPWVVRRAGHPGSEGPEPATCPSVAPTLREGLDRSLCGKPPVGRLRSEHVAQSDAVRDRPPVPIVDSEDDEGVRQCCFTLMSW